MPSFFLAEIEVLDPQMYREYVQKASPIVLAHGGQYILRSDTVVPVSGDWTPQRLILIRFERRAELDRCFGSEEYQRIKHLRERSTKSQAVIIDQDTEIGRGDTP